MSKMRKGDEKYRVLDEKSEEEVLIIRPGQR